MIDVAIVTIKREEFDALLERFPLVTEAPRPELESEYKFRRVSSRGRSRTVAITRCVMQGTGDAQTVVKRVVTDLQPGLVLVVGIAGMPPSKDVFLGDIVLGTHIHDFNLAAETPRGIELAERGSGPAWWLNRYVCNLDFHSPEYSGWHEQLTNRPTTSEATLEFTTEDAAWNAEIRECIKHHAQRQHPKVADGPIASSDDLLKNPEGVRKRLAVDRQILAVEMESAGAARACNNVAKNEIPTPFLPVRSISDIVGLKRDAAWEQYAFKSVALFAARFIEQLPADFMPAQENVPDRGSDLARVIASMTDATQQPFPTAIIQTTLPATDMSLKEALKDEIASGRVLEGEDGLTASAGVTARTLPESSTFLTSLLESLLRYIQAHGETDKGISQVRAAVVLANAVLPQAPHLAASVYDTLDHPMKALGDKALVRRVADMCIAAASKRLHDRQAAECIARARICGFSWVHQRTNELDLAHDEASKSLELGEKLGYRRNDAFCLKCLGRLLRMRAERASAASERDKFLDESIAKLGAAIDLFSELPDFGNVHPQVGDCYSLLGRTYLVKGDLPSARKAGKEAERRITDNASKHFFDLQILLGDLAMISGGTSTAVEYYTSVISKEGARHSSDYEVSEIVARALLQRGHAKKSSSKQAAKQDFSAAAEIWNQLGEDYFASEARWEMIKLEDNIPPKTLRDVEKESPEVRIRAYEWIMERSQSKSAKVVAQRKAHDQLTWQQALQYARKEIALDKYR